MQSATKRNKFEMMGQYVLICFNEQEILPTEEDGETQYQYDSAKVPLLAKRCDVIQSLIKIKYPDLDSEFAARINGGDEQEQHGAWRVTAKAVADAFEVYVKDSLS
jgi:hypothetical protein